MTVMERTKEWKMVDKAEVEVERVLRKFPFEIRLNKVYFYDKKDVFRGFPDKRVEEVLQRSQVSAFYDQQKNNLYLDVYESVGDEFTTCHELAHVYDYQHDMVSMKKKLVDAFMMDRGKWHETSFISGGRSEKPYEFFADFVALLVTAGKEEAKQLFPNYYKTFLEEIGYLKVYWCSKCKQHHQYQSKIGKEHQIWRVENS